MYAQGVRQPVTAERSSTIGLLLGLVITLAAVIAYTGYITVQIKGLRELQRDITDRNRRDSLQLLRIQNDLNSLGIAMRDMLDKSEPYPLSAWGPQFQRIKQDLNDALNIEERLSVEHRTPEQRQYLKDSLAQFWVASDRTFALAAESRRPGGARADHDGDAAAGSCAQHRGVAHSWWPITRRTSKRANASRKFTTVYSGRCTGFCWPR